MRWYFAVAATGQAKEREQDGRVINYKQVTIAKRGGMQQRPQSLPYYVKCEFYCDYDKCDTQDLRASLWWWRHGSGREDAILAFTNIFNLICI